MTLRFSRLFNTTQLNFSSLRELIRVESSEGTKAVEVDADESTEAFIKKVCTRDGSDGHSVLTMTHVFLSHH
ncbi:unnamed protein product [Medioppia subpectinata]|uniref:Uncharacterized protein n=1 Tax=Medioppia subpectinata TaxID=1979941 RepID=A0A7R9KR42_9ACAR|nr:unnamed protein product [Medioppia subpectinata]CAG2107050.1 unnamed protein product [Medioppia subpectinata]